jgi:hypothetical protein
MMLLGVQESTYSFIPFKNVQEQFLDYFLSMVGKVRGRK